MQTIGDGQRAGLDICRRSGLGDAGSRGEAVLLQEVILRGLLRQAHCGSDVLAVAHTGIVKVGGDGVVCASVQGHVVEGHAGDVRVCRAIIRLGRSRYPGDRQRLLPNADRHAGGCGIVVVCIAKHPIPHFICSGIGAGRDVLAVWAVLGQAVLHGAMARHAARSNQRLLLSGIGQIFLRRGSDDRAGRDGGLVDLDGHSSGRGCIFRCIRRKRPFGFIAVICSWRDCAILPCECAFDFCTVVGVLHRAGDFDLAQRLTVGDLGGCERQRTVQNRGELVVRRHRDGLLRRCGVVGGSLSGHFDGEGRHSGGIVRGLQLVILKRDTGGRTVQRVGQLRAAVGVVEGRPAGDIHCHAVLRDRPRSFSRDLRRGLLNR